MSVQFKFSIFYCQVSKIKINFRESQDQNNKQTIMALYVYMEFYLCLNPYSDTDKTS